MSAKPLPLPAVAASVGHMTPVTIVAFGSSSTEGVGASMPSRTYPARLEAELSGELGGVPVTVLNAGIGGQDAEDMIRRLPAILADHPTLVIWQTGTNDPLRGVPVDRFAALTRDGIEAIRAAGADVMLIEPQSCAVFDAKPGALAYRDALRTIAAEMRVSLVRRYDLMKSWLARGLITPKQLQSPDGLHMADGGYALLARTVADMIVAAGTPAKAISTR